MKQNLYQKIIMLCTEHLNFIQNFRLYQVKLWVLTAQWAIRIAPLFLSLCLCLGLGRQSAFAQATFSATGLPVAIPDPGNVSRTIVVSGLSGTVADANEVQINFNISHAWASDIVVGITPPGGAEILIVNRIGGGVNIDMSGMNTLSFRNNASGTIPVPGLNGVIPAGVYLPTGASPVGSLASLVGATRNGDWTIRVGDADAIIQGSLSEVSITFFDACTAVTPSVSIAANPSGSITTGTSVTFTATPTNGGTTPSYQWKKGSTNVGTNSATYIDAGLANGDKITCVMNSNVPCASPTSATSNEITMAVTAACVTPTAYTVTGGGAYCAGGAGVAVGLSNSETGVSYQLKKDNVNVGSPVSGTTGSAISFGNQTAVETYTVVATRTTGGCTAPMTGSVTVTANSVPTVDAISDQAVCNGTSTTAVTFTGTVPGTIYNWTNDTPSIGLAASGTGNIGAFTATNTGTTPISARIDVTPDYTSGGVTCPGTAKAFFITVNPTPTVNTVSNQTVCTNSSTTAVTFTGSGTTYSWTNNNPSIGLAASGTGNIGAFTATNSGTSPVTAMIMVTPSYTNGGVTCDGTPKTFTITVTPTVTITPGPSLTISSTQTATFTASGGATYNWSSGQNTPAISVSVAGTYSVTGTTNGCSGTASVVLSVTSAAPIITTQPATASSVCEGASAMVSVVVSNNVTGYQWLKGGNPVPGQTGPILALGNVQVGDAGVYSLSITGPGGSTTSNGFTLTVNPVPTATIIFPNSVTVAGAGLPGSPVPVVRVPSLNPPVVFQASGGVLYERLMILDRINGYEIRQVDNNTMGIFPINRLGLFTLTVTNAGGCQRRVEWVVQTQ